MKTCACHVVRSPRSRPLPQLVVADSGPVIRAFGCMPAINDSDSCPAFVYLICAELSKSIITTMRRPLLTVSIVVVLLTLLKRHLEPLAFGTSSISVPSPLLSSFAVADSSSYSSVLLYTMYRDGLWFGISSYTPSCADTICSIGTWFWAIVLGKVMTCVG